VLINNNICTIDISQTPNITRFIEKKAFERAYDVACLGAASADFKMLGIESL